MYESLFALFAALSAKPVGTAVMLTVIAFTVSVRRHEFERRLGIRNILPMFSARRSPLLSFFRHAA